MRTNDVEVAIAGAGPAGAAAALVLARAGRRVVLVDRRIFPRDKVCGDLLGADAVATLVRLGVDEPVLHDALPLVGAVLHGPRGTRAGAAATQRPSRRSDARVLKRQLLDARMLACARDAGAEVVHALVLGVLRDAAGRVRGVRTSEGDIAAALTIGADGWGSVVARALGVAAPKPRYAAVTVRAYATETADLDRRMHFFINPPGEGYGWVFPLDERTANVGLGFIVGEPGEHALNRAFERFTGPFSPARALLGGSGFAPPATWPIPLGWRALRSAAPGALLAGDAASLASPLSGSGIHNALASGSGAARFALRTLGGDEGAWRAYARWLRATFAMRLRVERIVHDLTGTPGRIEPWLAAATLLPGAGPALSRALLALG